MRRTPLPFLPDPVQKLLLKACLANGPDVVRFWEQWRREVEFENIDPGSQRLIPMLYRRLRSAGVEGSPLLEKYKGIYKRSWYRNGLLFDDAATLVRAFDRAGIPAMILKGVALALLHYQDRGARPMSDLDLLVPMERTRAAIELLRAIDWRAKDQSADLTAERPLSFGWAIFSGKRGTEIDLQCHILDLIGSDAESYFWAHSQALEFDGVTARTLDDTAQLMHVCVHGAAWNEFPPLRWVADAAMIIQRGTVDWSRLEADAHQFQLILPLRDTLAYLSENMNVPVPRGTLERLGAAEVPRAFVNEYRALQIADFRGSAWLSLRYHYARYLRSLNADDPGGALQFLRYVQSRFRGPLLLSVPFRFPVWIFRGIRRFYQVSVAGSASRLLRQAARK